MACPKLNPDDKDPNVGNVDVAVDVGPFAFAGSVVVLEPKPNTVEGIVDCVSFLPSFVVVLELAPKLKRVGPEPSFLSFSAMVLNFAPKVNGAPVALVFSALALLLSDFLSPKVNENGDVALDAVLDPNVAMDEVFENDVAADVVVVVVADDDAALKVDAVVATADVVVGVNDEVDDG